MSEPEISVVQRPTRKRIDVAVMFALCGALFSLLVFLYTLKQEHEAAVQQFNLSADRFVTDFQQELAHDLYLLDSLQVALGFKPDASADAIAKMISSVEKGSRWSKGIVFSTADGVQYSSLGAGLFGDTEFNTALQQAQRMPAPITQGLSYEGELFVLASKPLGQGRAISMLMSVAALLSSLEDQLGGVSGQLKAQDNVLFSFGELNSSAGAVVTRDLRLPQADWQVMFIASDAHLESAMSWAPALFLLTGLLLSFLAAFYLKRLGGSRMQMDEMKIEKLERPTDITLHDPLTGLFNRLHFDEMLDIECRRAVREFSPLSLMLLRIDHFTPYAECYGVEKSEALLQEIAKMVSSTIGRPGDLIARLDDHLFGFILPSTNEQVVQLAGRYCEMIREQGLPHEASPTGKVVTLSIGVATLQPSRMLTPDTLLDFADKQLNVAVEAGGDQYQAYTEETSEPSATYSV